MRAPNGMVGTLAEIHWSKNWVCILTHDGNGKTGPRFMLILENFAQAVRGEAPLIAPGVEGVSSVELANAMLLSGGSGQVVQLPLDAGRYRRWLNGQKRSEKQKVKTEKTGSSGSVTDLSGSFGT